MTLAGASMAVAGCGSQSASVHGSKLQVAASIYALADIASQVGGQAVEVTDLAAAGANPRTEQLPATDVGALNAAAVVVEVGGGYQPALETVAGHGRRVITVADSLATAERGPWLDPTRISKLASALQSAFSAADPADAATFANGARDVEAEMDSLAADFESTLAGCPIRTVITPDSAFADFSAAYELTDRDVGDSPTSSPTTIASEVVAARAAQVTTIFTEPWSASTTISAVASAAHLKVRPLDPLTGIPAGGWPRGATYSRLIEVDLSTITTALACSTGAQT